MISATPTPWWAPSCRKRCAGHQMDLTTRGADYVSEEHQRFQRRQEAIHGGERLTSN